MSGMCRGVNEGDNDKLSKGPNLYAYISTVLGRVIYLVKHATTGRIKRYQVASRKGQNSAMYQELHIRTATLRSSVTFFLSLADDSLLL